MNTTSRANKHELEAAIIAARRSLDDTLRQLKADGRGRGADDYGRGFLEATRHARDLLKIVVKTYQIREKKTD